MGLATKLLYERSPPTKEYAIAAYLAATGDAGRFGILLPADEGSCSPYAGAATPTETGQHLAGLSQYSGRHSAAYQWRVRYRPRRCHPAGAAWAAAGHRPFVSQGYGVRELCH